MTPAQRLLVDVTRTLPSVDGPPPNLGERLAAVDDAAALVREAVDARVVGLLRAQLHRAGLLDAVPEAQRQALREHYLATAARNLALRRDVAEIAARLAPGGHRLLVLKGAALLGDVYPDPGTRELYDVDLRVDDGSRPALRQALDDLGYEPDALYPGTFRRPPTVLDLHDDLLGAERIGARRRILARGDDPLVARAAPAGAGDGIEVMVLDRHDRVLLLCLHALKHNLERLVWLQDLQQLVRGWEAGDWTTLRQRAREQGQEAAVLAVCHAAGALLGGFRGPDTGALPAWERRLLARRERLGHLPLWAPLLLYSVRDDGRGRAATILETLFPRPAVLRQVIDGGEDMASWRLYGRRVLDLADRVLRSLRRGP